MLRRVELQQSPSIDRDVEEKGLAFVIRFRQSLRKDIGAIVFGCAVGYDYFLLADQVADEMMAYVDML